ACIGEQCEWQCIAVILCSDLASVWSVVCQLILRPSHLYACRILCRRGYIYLCCVHTRLPVECWHGNYCGKCAVACVCSRFCDLCESRCGGDIHVECMDKQCNRQC